MALPKKKGIRKLVYEDQRYFWTVKFDANALKLVVRVGLEEQPNTFFVFTVNYEDPWLSFPHQSTNEVNAITPKFIKKSIIYANEHVDWKEKSVCIFEYSNGIFTHK